MAEMSVHDEGSKPKSGFRLPITLLTIAGYKKVHEVDMAVRACKSN